MYHTSCCKRGKEYLTYIKEADCVAQDIEPPASGFYIDVSRSYPDPSWERIYYCPFCGKGLLPLIRD